MIKVKFFAQLRDHAGMDSLELPLGEMRVVRDLISGLDPLVPRALIDALSDESALVSIDQRYAAWDAALEDGAEVGILPPVSGG